MVCDVRSDELELYLQSRAKQNEHHMTKEGWMELLDITIPKLKCRRELRNIHKATRLAYVMGLVGSRRDTPLASRAVAALLVDHWCPDDSYAFLQKDAMRYATVAFLRAEMRDPWERENIALQLELGVRSALDGVGLEFLETFPAWRRDRHILFPGGAELLLEEVDDLASECRKAQSDSEALAMLEQYVAVKRMDTFCEDFIEWGKVQLDNVPEAMFDRTTPKQAASPSSEPARSKPKSSGAAEGSRSNRARGGGGGANGGASGGASGAGPRNHRGRQPSTRQSSPEGKQSNPKQMRNSSSASTSSTASSTSTSDSGNSRRSKSMDKGSGRDEGRGRGRGEERGNGRSTSKGLGVKKQKNTNPRSPAAPAERPVRGKINATRTPERKTKMGTSDKTPNSGNREVASGSSSRSGSSSDANTGARSGPGSGSGCRSRPGSKSGSRPGSRRGSKSVPAPAHVNDSDCSKLDADCLRDRSSSTEDCSFESDREEVDEEADRRSVKRLKTSGSNAPVHVEGGSNGGTQAKAGRKAATAARDKTKSHPGFDGVTERTVRPLAKGCKPAMVPTEVSARRLGIKGPTLRGPAKYRLGGTDESIPSTAPRRLLQVVHAITRDGGGVSGYFDHVPEVIASLRKLALFDLEQIKLASETSEYEVFLRASFASALCTTGRSEGYEFLPLTKYVLQEAYEGPKTMSAAKVNNLLSGACSEGYTIVKEFPRFSFRKLSPKSLCKVIFVIQKR